MVASSEKRHEKTPPERSDGAVGGLNFQKGSGVWGDVFKQVAEVGSRTEVDGIEFGQDDEIAGAAAPMTEVIDGGEPADMVHDQLPAHHPVYHPLGNLGVSRLTPSGNFEGLNKNGFALKHRLPRVAV